MHKNNGIIVFIFLCSTLFCSCKKDISTSVSVAEVISAETKQNSELRLAFGSALSKAMIESQELRAFLRTEALNKFNNDFDILYFLVKDKRVDRKRTFRQIIEVYFEDKSKLALIESKIPLLTIFVPELPENTFSANLWDVSNEAPSVGVSFRHTNEVAIINNDHSYIMSSEKIPAFPVIVIKENERVAVVENSEKTGFNGSRFTVDGYKYQFIDDCFDASKNDVNSRVTFSLDQRIIDAYNIYSGTDGWHRDYIYYGITPTNPTGPFSYDFQEHITTFSMNGDATAAYNKIADQTGDPTLKDKVFHVSSTPPSQSAGWTGGSFEFKVKVLFNGRNGVGSEFVTYFSALGTELFNFTYRKFSYYWIPEALSLKTKDISLPIFNWDLNQYAAIAKVEVEEVDLTETTTISETDNVKFATNFAIEGTIFKKIGLKFGSSLEINQTRTTTRTFVQGNDLLGSVLINFADNVILSTQQVNGQTQYTTRDYETGFFKLSMEPVRVQ